MRTDAERERMAARIAAEFASLEMAAREIADSTGGHYVPLDAFLLHARKLRDFFLGPAGNGGDRVRAEHFFEDPSVWDRAREGVSDEWLERTRGPLDHHVASIGWEAGDDRMKWGEWMRAAPDIHAELKAHWDIFLYNVDATSTNWFVKAYERYRGLQTDWGQRERAE